MTSSTVLVLLAGGSAAGMPGGGCVAAWVLCQLLAQRRDLRRHLGLPLLAAPRHLCHHHRVLGLLLLEALRHLCRHRRVLDLPLLELPRCLLHHRRQALNKLRRQAPVLRRNQQRLALLGARVYMYRAPGERSRQETPVVEEKFAVPPSPATARSFDRAGGVYEILCLIRQGQEKCNPWSRSNGIFEKYTYH